MKKEYTSPKTFVLDAELCDMVASSYLQDGGPGQIGDVADVRAWNMDDEDGTDDGSFLSRNSDFLWNN